MTIVVKKVPKFLRGFVKFIFGIKDQLHMFFIWSKKHHLNLFQMMFIYIKYYMFPNLAERKHLEHTDIFFVSPFTLILTVLRFGFHVLVALLLT